VSQSTDADARERPAGIRRSTSYLPAVESLRGIAILLVFSYHADEILGGGHGYLTGSLVSPLHAFVTAGHSGVTLFFVLSAFLLSRPFLARTRSGAPMHLRDFYARRALRILPAYAAAILLSVALRFGTPGIAVDGFGALFFLNSFSGLVEPLFPYSAVWWSLATEVQFYLVLPLLGVFVHSTLGRRAGGLFLLAYACLYFGVVLGPLRGDDPAAHQTLMLSVFGRGPAFLAGIGAAWLYERFGPRIQRICAASRWIERGAGDALVLAVLLGLGLLFREVTRLGFFPAEHGWHVWHLAEAGLWAAVTLLFSLVPFRLRPLFANRALAAIGVVSYSLYLWHYPVLHFLLGGLRNLSPSVATGDPYAGIFAVALVFGLCLALSGLTYRFIERPFLVRKARIDP
jgi:peptidoglycan/LPS O-acetylase OafA/YrhL